MMMLYKPINLQQQSPIRQSLMPLLARGCLLVNYWDSDGESDCVCDCSLAKG